MSLEYLVNVITYLEANADCFFLATRRRFLLEDVTDVFLGRLPVNAVAEALGATPLAAVSSTDWVLGTSLMRSLRREQSRRY